MIWPDHFLASYLYNWWKNWQQFWFVFHLWYRVDDLERLVAWAKRKRLDGPRSYYTRLLVDTELRLNSYCMRFPKVATWAFRLYRLGVILCPPPRYYAKGSAAIYLFNK